MKIQDLAKRVLKIEKHLQLTEKDKENRNLQAEVVSLDWKHHGWLGSVGGLADDREEWKDAQEIIDLIRKHDSLAPKTTKREGTK